jgi:hypothetical protein
VEQRKLTNAQGVAVADALCQAAAKGIAGSRLRELRESLVTELVEVNKAVSPASSIPPSTS